MLEPNHKSSTYGLEDFSRPSLYRQWWQSLPHQIDPFQQQLGCLDLRTSGLNPPTPSS
jgi:hypothetical protein